MSQWGSAGFQLVLAVTVLVIVGFVIGTIRNRRLLEEYLARLRGPLLTYGEKATARRLGTSAYHIIVPKAKWPFHKMDVMVYLQPREFIFYWWLNMLRGRGDRVYLQLTLQRPPLQELRVGSHPPSSEEGKWQQQETDLWRAPLYVKGSLTPEMKEFLQRLAATVPQLTALTVRRKAPHVTCIVPLAALPDVHTVDRFFEVLRAIPLAKGQKRG